jgi:ATP-dependent DNA helicase RecQ
LRVYEERARQDKERLAEMMHYAESPQCRIQLIRAYFGEPAGEACSRCDNCEHASEQARVDAGTKESPTTIETIHGLIVTTAPETLPKNEPEPFKPGDKVLHRRFGPGRVKDAFGNFVLVHFENAGDRRVQVSYLEAA